MRYWIVLALAVLFSSVAHAEEVALFNGRDLSGWTHFIAKTGANADGHVTVDDVFTVKEGGILHVAGSPFGYVRTDKEYTNYRLQLEWRWVDLDQSERNTGVLVRMSGADRLWPMTYEIEISEIPQAKTGDIWIMGYDKAHFKSDPALIEPNTEALDGTFGFGWRDAHRMRIRNAEKRPGEWNTYDITVDEDRIVVKLNGKLVNQGSGAEIVPGTIALQSEGSPVEFRNIRLTPIAR